MFVNDLTGLCRNNVFGFDINNQFQVPFNTWSNIPYGYGLGSYNVPGQVLNPMTVGMLYNRIPQTLTQGFGQGFGQGIVPQTFGQVGQHIVPMFTTNVPFTNPIVTHGHLLSNTFGYGFNPYGIQNWTSPLGFQSTICR